MNYDALKHREKPLSKMRANGRITTGVIDDLSHYGNTRTARWKAADGLFNPRSGRAPEYVWALTGTPGADVMAVYGFANLVNPKAMPWKTYDGWQVSLRYKWGRENWQWRDRASAPETVRQVLQPNIRYNKEDVLKDLPPVTRTRLEAELTDEQSDMFATLKLEMTALTAGGEKVKADRKAALISKLFQVAAGGVITDSGLSAVDASPRNEMILGLVRDNPRKTVIFCAFRGVVDLLAEYLTKNDVPTVKVHGDVTGRTRDKAFESFQNSDKYKAMVAHPVTTAYGTELSAADQLIINGPLLSGSHTYMQGLERLSSSRQKSDRVSIVEVVASKEEAMFFNTLDYRVGQADAVSRLFEYITQGGAIHGRSKRSLQRA
jgi:hypothetical protein